MFHNKFGRIFGSKEKQSALEVTSSGWSPVANPQDPSLTHHSSESSFKVPRKPVATTTESIRVADRDGHGAYQSVGAGAENKTPKKTSLLRIWWLEIVNCVLLVLAFLAVVATIRPYEGRPLPKWPYRLNINALISIYMVILKGAILLVTAEGLSQLKWMWFSQERPLRDLETYDKASRGPWGSLMLLRRLKFRELVASIGAFITIATLIVDPFAQQVVTTVDCLLPAKDGIATIPRTNNFDEPGRHIHAATVSIRLPLQNAMNAGIFNPGQHVAVDCTTGNCTFPETYHTVGFCSQCNDTTYRLMVNSEATDSTYQSYNLTLNTTVYYEDNVTAHMGYGYNDYMVMKSQGGITNLLAGYVAGPKSPSCPKTCASLSDKTRKECRENWDQVEFGCTSLPDGVMANGLMDNNPGFGAATCSLFPCLRTYSAYISAGRLQEILKATYDVFGNGEQGVYLPSLVDLDCVSDTEKKALTAVGYILPTNTPWLGFNHSLNRTAPADERDIVLDTPDGDVKIPAGCVYQYSLINAMSISTFMEGFLNGSINPGSEPYDFLGPMQLQSVFQEGNLTFASIEGVWANMSDAITGYMRQRGEEGFSEPAVGIAWQTQTCVRVRWAFLAYPALLVILAIIFMGSMLAETRRRDQSRNDWKSSSLALMFHGLDRQTVSVSRDTGATDVGEMKRIATETPVRLARTGSGWQFAGTGHDLK